MNDFSTFHYQYKNIHAHKLNTGRWKLKNCWDIMIKLLIIVAVSLQLALGDCQYRLCTRRPPMTTTKKPISCCIYQKLTMEKLIDYCINYFEVDREVDLDLDQDSTDSCCKYEEETLKNIVKYLYGNDHSLRNWINNYGPVWAHIIEKFQLVQ